MRALYIISREETETVALEVDCTGQKIVVDLFCCSVYPKDRDRDHKDYIVGQAYPESQNIKVKAHKTPAQKPSDRPSSFMNVPSIRIHHRKPHAKVNSLHK